MVHFLKLLIFLFLECSLISLKQIESLFIKNPPESWLKGTKDNVILIQGFNETWVFLKTIGNFLNNLGYKIYTVPALGRNFVSIQDASKIIEEYIEKNNFDRVILIGHSKGGTIIKYLLDNWQYNSKITKAITIATPYKGSIISYLSILSLHQISPTSSIIKQLDTKTALNKRIINFYPEFDNFVIPNKNLILEEAENICIPIIGHTRILESKKTREKLINIMDKELPHNYSTNIQEY